MLFAENVKNSDDMMCIHVRHTIASIFCCLQYKPISNSHAKSHTCHYLLSNYFRVQMSLRLRTFSEQKTPYFIITNSSCPLIILHRLGSFGRCNNELFSCVKSSCPTVTQLLATFKEYSRPVGFYR